LFITWSFSFLNAIRISNVPEHYINHLDNLITILVIVLY
jgi:hypothetical protein